MVVGGTVVKNVIQIKFRKETKIENKNEKQMRKKNK